MKKYILFLFVLPLIVGCNQKKIKQLETSNDSLAQQAYMKDQSINDFIKSFNEIQDNLDSIKTKEMIITENTEGKTELKTEVKDQINNDINLIYNLLTETKNKLSDMRKKLGKAEYQIDELEKMVAHLTKQLEEKDMEIESLRRQLEQLNIQVTMLTRNVQDLKTENAEQEGVIKDQAGVIKETTDELNTAYYVIGTKKSLKENNILTSEGGFIGIGKNKKLSEDFNTELFTKIDIRQTTQIMAPGKKAQIVTTHSTSSYKISGEGDSRVIEILDKNEFWKASKYLVIVTD
jgi:chromosome segregation ATPase